MCLAESSGSHSAYKPNRIWQLLSLLRTDTENFLFNEEIGTRNADALAGGTASLALLRASIGV
jgi:hypothetical protein